METEKVKKIILTAIPIAAPFYIADKASQVWRQIPNRLDVTDKATTFLEVFSSYISKHPVPSFNIKDLLVGAVAAAALNGYLYYRKKNAKKDCTLPSLQHISRGIYSDQGRFQCQGVYPYA